MDVLLEIADSELGGKGSFTARDIKKGEIIKILSGERVSFGEITQRVKLGQEKVDDPLQIGEETYLDLDESSRLINHSCEPNAGIRKECELFALRDIRKGEEITFDYSTTVGIESGWWHMDCHCKSASCRKRIGNILTLPDSVLANYQKAGALPDFITRQLKEI